MDTTTAPTATVPRRQSGRRTFDFEPGIQLGDAIRVIRDALEDEGLRLGTQQTLGGERIRLILVYGVARVIVPADRIEAPR